MSAIKGILSLCLLAIFGVITYQVIAFLLDNPWVIVAAAAPVVVFAGWLAWQWADTVKERKLMIRAERRQMENRSRTIDTSDGTWFIQRYLNDGSTEIASLHNNPLWEINGHREPVTQAELFAWQAYNRRGANGKEITQLQSGMMPLSAPSGPDFFTALSDPFQAYAIIGPQRIGKSSLAQRLAQHLARQGRICIAIGTKAEPGEWAGCRRFIGNEAVLSALDHLLLEEVRRLSVNCKTPPLAVFLDDWINSTVLDAELCERFFIEASTRFLTAGIVPYFLLQSDSKADWGTRHGATLKNNFVHLMLSAPRVNGQLDHSQLKGEIVYPGDKERHPVRLPQYQRTVAPDLVLAPGEAIQPAGIDQQIIELANRGAAYKEITETVWGAGKFGKFYNDKVDKILVKYGLRIS